ncbi:MAG: LemA family protein [Deltaproteobacteria bacterium]|nr:LemA family protein [Deltaproteobacteria bacterium]
MKKVWIILAIVALALLIFGSSCVSKYNQLVTLNEGIAGAWSQVENVLQRRNDLIPNLVNTVKGYAAHEQEIFENVAQARSQWASAKTINEKVRANAALESALGRLLAVVERYPDLKASQNFLALQDELAGTENRIATERRRYNEVVRQYNTLVRRFPTNLVAKVTGFEYKQVYFEAQEGAQEVPPVSF